MYFSKNWDGKAFIHLVDKEMALPGEEATVELNMMKPKVLEEGDRTSPYSWEGRSCDIIKSITCYYKKEEKYRY